MLDELRSTTRTSPDSGKWQWNGNDPQLTIYSCVGSIIRTSKSFCRLSADHLRFCEQLMDDEQFPSKATKSLEAGISQLRRVAERRTILVVLDDMWDAKHERPFSCIDPATISKILMVRLNLMQVVIPLFDCRSFSDDSHQGHHAQSRRYLSGTTRCAR